MKGSKQDHTPVRPTLVGRAYSRAVASRRPQLPWTRLLIAIGFLALFATLVQAFPPAPFHRFYGLVRNEFGHPIRSENARIFFKTPSGRVIRSIVVPQLGPGMNYRLDIPMDAGVTKEQHKPTAMRPQMPFEIEIQIGNQRFLPIEMNIEKNALMGFPGKRTHLDLTLGEDADGDGLPDAWEAALLASLRETGDVDPDADSDGDGLTNREEYITGNYAYDDEHEFDLSIVGFNQGAPILEFMAIRGRSYSVYASTDLDEWTQVSFRPAGSDEDAEYQEYYFAEDVRTVEIEAQQSDSAAPRQYYRLVVQ